MFPITKYIEGQLKAIQTIQPVILFVSLSLFLVQCQPTNQVQETVIGEGWSGNSVNAVIFRKNSLTTHQGRQYAAYYDQDAYVVLARRESGSDKWVVKRSSYQGNARDAHNSISIAVDGDGYLHMAWDHHNTPLRYVKSESTGSLDLSTELAMTGHLESSVSYPEFYKLPSGDLLFFYRSGESGNGNLVIKKYDVEKQNWELLQDNLIDGEGQRNAYWQACVDRQGVIHISWVWRETWDVASNHDLNYARSRDGGVSWERSDGTKYDLPINLESAEVAQAIPQKSELINQTSMTTDSKGNPIIASYWRDLVGASPQYHVVYFDGASWSEQQVSNRLSPFTLSGGGTKQIPISRPQVLSKDLGDQTAVYLIFRDAERGKRASVYINQDFPKGDWQAKDLIQSSVGEWEPSYDIERWKNSGTLSLFVQKVVQIDGEGLADIQPEPVRVLDWTP